MDVSFFVVHGCDHRNDHRGIEDTELLDICDDVREYIMCSRSLDAAVIRASRSFDLRSNGI